MANCEVFLGTPAPNTVKASTRLSISGAILRRLLFAQIREYFSPSRGDHGILRQRQKWREEPRFCSVSRFGDAGNRRSGLFKRVAARVVIVALRGQTAFSIHHYTRSLAFPAPFLPLGGAGRSHKHTARVRRQWGGKMSPE